MSELSTEYFRWCKSNEHFEKKVAGSNGNVYTVVYGELAFKTDTTHGWTCTCPAYKYGKGAPCKHILAVMPEKCDWNWEASFGSPVSTRKYKKCPKCHSELSLIKIGV